MKKNHVKEIVVRFGGTRPCARALGYSRSTVDSWIARESIPLRHWDHIIERAAHYGVNVSTDDLVAVRVKSVKIK